MKYKAYALMAILLASVAAMGPIGSAFAQALTVETDNTDYAAEDTITISGNVGTVVPGQPVLIKVTNPNGAIYRLDQIPATEVAADGSYTYELRVGGNLGISGQYTVDATYGGVTQSTTFNFTSGEGPSDGFDTITMVITAEDGTEDEHEIEYMITGGTLEELTGDQASKTITAVVSADADGELVLRIPRDIADADGQFEVFVDGEDVTEEVTDDEGDDVRELRIPIFEGSETVEIVGTFMIPEFGAIAAVVLAVAIVGIIVATTRYSKFSFLPRM